MARLRRPKQKGDGYERELAAYLNEHLFDGREQCARAILSGGGRQFAGGGGSDLTGVPGFWVEAKRTERFTPYEAMAQAEKGIAGKSSPDLPVVISRRSRMKTGESLVVMRLDDFIPLLRAVLDARGLVAPRKLTPDEARQRLDAGVKGLTSSEVIELIATAHHDSLQRLADK